MSVLDEQSLTAAERRVADASSRGETTDFREPGESVARGATWGSHRTLRAEVLVTLLTQAPAVGTPIRVLSVDGARISGPLRLEAMSLQRPLILRGCYFEHPVILNETRAAKLDLSGSRLPKLSGRQLTTRGDLLLDGVVGLTLLEIYAARIEGVLSLEAAHLSNHGKRVLDGEGLTVDGMDCRRLDADGELWLVGAHVGGYLSLSGARLTNPRRRALVATRLHVGHDFLCTVERGHRFTSHGEIDIAGAQVDGQVNLSGARLSNQNGPALIAVGLDVGQDLLCRTARDGNRFETCGEMRLLGAHIAGQFSLNGARLTNEAGRTLGADRLRVDGDLLCRADHLGQRFESHGALRLWGAQIGGELSLHDAHLSGQEDVELDFRRGRADRLSLPRPLASESVIDLRNAGVAEFEDDPVPAPGELGYQALVGGFTYSSLGPDASDHEARLAWLARAADGYRPGAYDQLAAALRRAGREEDAKSVMIAKQVRRRGTLSPPSRAASYVFGAVVGYGYRTWRAAGALLAIVLLGWGVFSLAYPAHMVATRDTDRLPDYHALAYSLDAVLPVVNLGQETAWSAKDAAHAWYVFSVLAGWLLSLGLVSLVTARLFRE